jgi:hypothetical protein
MMSELSEHNNDLDEEASDVVTVVSRSAYSGGNRSELIISRAWAMPNAFTFTIEPIAQLVKKYVGDGVGWIDPFAGENSPADITNDLNPERPTTFHLDALEFLRMQGEGVKGVLYDPPYSITQARQMYDDFGGDKFDPSSMQYWGDCKKEIARIVRMGGMAICCGWNSNGVGKNRGFKMLEVLMVAHGGSKNDTLVTVERKVFHQERLPL